MKEIKWTLISPISASDSDDWERHELFLTSINEGGIIRFDGSSVPGIVEAEVTDYKIWGKWCRIDWTLQLASGMTEIRVMPNFGDPRTSILPILNLADWSRILWTQMYSYFLEKLQESSGVETASGPGLYKFRDFMHHEFPATAECVDCLEEIITDIREFADRIKIQPAGKIKIQPHTLNDSSWMEIYDKYVLESLDANHLDLSYLNLELFRMIVWRVLPNAAEQIDQIDNATKTNLAQTPEELVEAFKLMNPFNQINKETDDA